MGKPYPFIDGNKRTAFAATYAFLAINDWRLAVDPEQVYRFITNLYETHQFNFRNLADWLRAHATAVA